MRWPAARWIQVGVVVAAAIVLLWLPTYYEDTQIKVFATALYVAVAAMGLNLLTGYNGQVSIGHGAFFGIGAYTTAVLMRQYGWNFFVTLPVAALFAAAIGAAIGFPALRVKGLYLALITLGLAALFPDIVTKVVTDREWGTGGTTLVQPRSADYPAVPSWIPESLDSPMQWRYLITLSVCALMLLGAWLLVRARFGRALIAVRDHEAAASTVGIGLARVKVGAFALSAAYAGIAGSLSVLIQGSANTTRILTFTLSIEFLVAVVIGGAATVVGPVIGAWVFVLLDDWIRDFVGDPFFLEGFFGDKEVLSPAIFGIALILTMYVAPDGIVGSSKRLWRTVRRRLRRAELHPAPT